jgi:hypothetical protein
MTEDTTCRWVDGSLEAYLFDDLDPESRLRLEAHAETCADCAGEIDAHRHVEQLVQAVYRERLDTARRSKPAGAMGGWVFRPAWIAAAAIIVVLAGSLFVRTPAPASGVADDAGEFAAPDKAEEITVERAKPEDALESVPRAAEPLPVAVPGEFSLEDPAGYLLSLEDFRGSALVIGLLSPNDIAAFRAAYERFRGTDALRFIGIPAGSGELAPGIPAMRNRGESVLGTPPGGFVLVGPDGSVNGRGAVSDPAFEESIGRWIEEGFTLARVE